MKTKISMLIAATVMLVSCDIDKQPLSQLSPQYISDICNYFLIISME